MKVSDVNGQQIPNKTLLESHNATSEEVREGQWRALASGPSTDYVNIADMKKI